MKERKRLDVLLFEKGLTESREKAKALIMAGKVYIDGQKADKPGTAFEQDVEILLRQEKMPYVSRGGLKLEKAVRKFGIDLKDKVAVDIGASTGGFTDCMLQNGAKKIYAVDVGYGQLDWKLRNDPRVCNMERINVRYLKIDENKKFLFYNESKVPALNQAKYLLSKQADAKSLLKPADFTKDVKTFALEEPINFFSVDVSFISLKLILPVVNKLVAEASRGVCLIKPQFEAGRDKVGKKGVVKDPAVHAEVLKKVCGLAQEAGFLVKALTYSPIKGPEGNVEYLMYIEKTDKQDVLKDTGYLAELIIPHTSGEGNNKFYNKSIEDIGFDIEALVREAAANF